jgi:hypothetical protein
VAAIETTLDVAAERGGAAHRQVGQGAPLGRRQMAAVLGEKHVAVVSNHIRHFPRRPPESLGTLRGRVHSTIKMTPAVAAGLSSEPWSLERLLEEVNRV